MKHARFGAAKFAALVFAISLFTSWLVTGPLQLLASQGSNFLDTTGVYNGLTAANRMNAALDALLTCNSGSAAPTNALGGAPKLGQCWIDTTSATLPIKKRYTGSAWVVEAVLDVTNGLWMPPVGGGAGTVASASTTNLCTSPQALQTVTGSVTVTSFGSSCPTGVEKTLVFTGAPLLTYNGTSLILPGLANIQVAIGDVLKAVSLGAGNWRVTVYSPATGLSLVTTTVPLGTAMFGDYGVVPAKFVYGAGQALTRSSFPAYTAAVTRAQSGTLTSGNATITGIANTAGFGAGMPVEGSSGINAGCTIASFVANTSITLNSSGCVTANGSVTVTTFLTGYGSGGSGSTVGVKDCRGSVLAGRDDLGGSAASRLTTSFFGTGPNALNSRGSTAESTTLTLLQLPTGITFAGTTTFGNGGVATIPTQQAGGAFGNGNGPNTPTTLSLMTVANTMSAISSAPTTGTSNNTSGNAHRTVQPTVISDCIVAVLP